MATLNPTIQSVHVLPGIGSGAIEGLRRAMVLWTVTGTYATADTPPVQLLAVPTAIQNALHDGKEVTMVDVCRGQRGTKASSPASFMSTKAVVISSTSINLDITDGDETTELADGAVPAQLIPFGTIVTYTVA